MVDHRKKKGFYYLADLTFVLLLSKLMPFAQSEVNSKTSAVFEAQIHFKK